ncbi:MAG: hypothetical protein Ta2A_10480 [Treponemataceae bacterium]|nr:MAG: hypothetical protein Ta2A_10480 [Treponemataceae bacterium]
MKKIILFLLGVLLTGCASTGSLDANRQNASDAIAAMNSALSGAPKEIVGSAEDGTVLHKDVIYQNAKPGDYLTRKDGEKQRIVLQAGDIAFSGAEVERMNKELLDTKTGSVRALIDEFVDELTAEDDFVLSGEATAPEEIPYESLRGKVVEYISDIRNGKQIILIVAHKKHKTFFEKSFNTPPWTKAAGKIPPELVTLTFAKKVNSPENKMSSQSKNVCQAKVKMSPVLAK